MSQTPISALKHFCRSLAVWFLIVLPSAADAPIPVAPNLVYNGDFEKVQDKQAAGWSFSSAKPEIFKLTFPIEAGRGTVAQMDVASAVMSGYYNQLITVQPHTNYRFSALTRVTKGKTLIYIHGGSGKTKLDTRIYVDTLDGHPLVPWFWKKEWIQGTSGRPDPSLDLIRTFLAEPGEWHPVFINFNSGELNSVVVSLGAYFESGQYAFDDISLVAVPAAKAPTTDPTSASAPKN